VARGTDAIICLRTRSSAIERSLAFTAGLPSVCLYSSFRSCFDIRKSRCHFTRVQTRSPATKAIVATLTAETSRTDKLKSNSGRPIGSSNMIFTISCRSARRIIETTPPIARNLRILFPNSIYP